jgi:hypothetical protein
LAYTSTDLTAVDLAIANVRDGKVVTSIVISGKTIRFNDPPTLTELSKLRNEIKSEINVTANRPRFVLTSSRKGL